MKLKYLKRFIPLFFLFLVFCFLLFLIRPALLGQLGGTFKPHKIPQEYIELEKFLSSQKQFSRTLWVPTVQRFGFYSYQHPAVSAQDFFHVASMSGVIDELKKQEVSNKTWILKQSMNQVQDKVQDDRMSTLLLLQDAGVKYVIVPYDSLGEIFLTDRKYDQAMYRQTIQTLSRISWLKEIKGFGRIAVFEVPNPKGHFFIVPQPAIRNLQYAITSIDMVNPTKYVISVSNVKKGDILVFSESFDKQWIGKTTENRQQELNSQLYNKLFNSFVLPKSGSYTLTVFYQPQKWVDIGLMISGATLILLCLYGLIMWLKKIKHGKMSA